LFDHLADALREFAPFDAVFFDDLTGVGGVALGSPFFF